MLGEEGLVAHDYFPIFFKVFIIMTKKKKEIVAFIILYGSIIGGFILYITQL